MKSSGPKLLGEILKQYLNPQELDDSINRRRLEAAWVDVVGDEINRQTIRRFVNRRTLYVFLDSAPLRNELMLRRSVLVRLLNEAVGISVIDDIVFK